MLLQLYLLLLILQIQGEVVGAEAGTLEDVEEATTGTIIPPLVVTPPQHLLLVSTVMGLVMYLGSVLHRKTLLMHMRQQLMLIYLMLGWWIQGQIII
ncbi:hypothetical protein MANES_05G113201v8 [Manihot esculenta]|uniref:Uncharacterized protein n=1 Tax=Manihot esculenta TaxID=3983 RepID=A0ACB7HNZ9_MANES|nr:hypothetical protein MANES_05G113201v8 [Manihot esculenta]